MINAEKARESVLIANDEYIDNQILEAIKKGEYFCYVYSDRFSDKKRSELEKNGFNVTSNMTNTFFRICWSK